MPGFAAVSTLAGMFNVGPGELFAILALALIVLGPQRLPEAVRTVGRVVGELRRISSGFQDELRNALDDNEVERDLDRLRAASDRDGLPAATNGDKASGDAADDEDEVHDPDTLPAAGTLPVPVAADPDAGKDPEIDDEPEEPLVGPAAEVAVEAAAEPVPELEPAVLEADVLEADVTEADVVDPIDESDAPGPDASDDDERAVS